MPRVKNVLAWHFTNGMKLRDGTPLEVGKTYRHKGDVVMCKSGYHASERILDALVYATGNQISRVELWGDVQVDDDKIVARNRRVLWTLDATLILHEFACRVAEAALAKDDKPDPRSVAAIDAKRRWMRGEISDDELAAAKAAAWATAADAAATVPAVAAAKAAAWPAAGPAAWAEYNALLTQMIEDMFSGAPEEGE